MPQTSQRIPTTLLAVLLLAGAPRGALAQDERRSVALSYEAADPTAQAIEAAERKMRRGRAGLIASSVLLAGGTITLAFGVSDNLTFGKPYPELWVPGAIGMVGGFVGLVVSGVALSDGKRARRRIEGQRAQLFLGLTRAEFRLRF